MKFGCSSICKAISPKRFDRCLVFDLEGLDGSDTRSLIDFGCKGDSSSTHPRPRVTSLKKKKLIRLSRLPVGRIWEAVPTMPLMERSKRVGNLHVHPVTKNKLGLACALDLPQKSNVFEFFRVKMCSNLVKIAEGSGG